MQQEGRDEGTEAADRALAQQLSAQEKHQVRQTTSDAALARAMASDALEVRNSKAKPKKKQRTGAASLGGAYR